METIEINSPKTIEGYEVVDQTIKESITPYYTDMYTAGETKEQMTIGGEVEKPKERTGTIDTADSGLTTTSNVYTLSVANPDGAIFSLGITDKYGLKEKTFKIGYFGNTALAYSTLLTELQAWLGSDYEIAYVSGTNYTISRIDGTTFTKSSPNLVRTITLSGFDTISVIDVIVDGVTVSLNGATHSGSASTAITYLKSQLSTSLYYMNDSGSVLTIARKDGAIPAITKAQYNFYSYSINYTYQDTPNSGQYPDYTDTTIEGTTYRYDYIVDGRPLDGDKVVRNLVGQSVNDTLGTTDNTSTETTQLGIRILTKSGNKIKTVTKASGCTATRAILKTIGGTTLSTVSFSGDIATFNYDVSPNTEYLILCDNNGSSYTARTRTFGNVEEYNLFIYKGDYHAPTLSYYKTNIDGVEMSITIPFTVSAIFREYDGGTDTTWDPARFHYFGVAHSLLIYKTDYSSMSISSNTHYTVPGSFPDDTYGYSLTTTNHLADITTATASEISITLTNTGKAYLIDVGVNIKKIIMNAVSSGGSSEGTYEFGVQSCTTKYSTTTTFVSDKVFQTDGSNYGNILSVGMGRFIIQWTTNTSNKLTYTCYT